jgi:hypothetical protein
VTSATFPEKFIFNFALQSPAVFVAQPSVNKSLQSFAEHRSVAVDVFFPGLR